ncbi:MAG: DUF1080 domain-containing protein [Planctomycetes bacterium]|nr:DUF1080 domain-containing protein [Planctomycetota bacterium]
MHKLLISAVLFAACDSRGPSADTPRLSIAAQDKVTLKEDFEKDNPKWRFASGSWERRKSGEGHVLAQTSKDNAFNVALLEETRFSDADVTVRFKPVSGSEDASGGIVFRARDEKNYFLVRANALETNFRLYTVKDGKRGQIASTRVAAPALGEWHTIRVVAKGAGIQAYLDGKLLIDHEDKSFGEGWVGLWTKADSVTEFDDLEISGVASK